MTSVEGEGRRSKSGRTTVLVFALFAVFTLAHLSPLSWAPLDSVHDPGDPLLNSWILSRVDDQLVRDPLHLFQANIFHPHRDTLALSEHMLPLAAATAPLYFATGNAVLAHNAVLWLAFLLNGFAMFLLVRRLTRTPAAGLLSGVVFAFGTFRFMHVSHIQLCASFWIPFGLLAFHDFLAERTWRASILFSLFFVLQALSCLYYGLFTIAVLALILPVFIVLSGKRIDGAFLAKLALPLVGAAAVLIPFCLPYLRVFEALGLKRELMPGAELQNYLSVVPSNILFGKLLSGLGTHEKFLFPGIAAMALAAAAIFWSLKAGANVPGTGRRRLVGSVVRIAILVFAVLSLASFVAALAGGVDLKWGVVGLSAKSVEKPALYLFLLGAGFLAYKTAVLVRKAGVSDRSRGVFGYAVLTVWALALSFGGGFTVLGKTTKMIPMPFALFYRYIPGFDGIREPVRFAVFVLFGVAVLAGFGFVELTGRMRRTSLKYAVAGILFVALNLEYLSVPVERTTVPTGRDIPPTYFWLKERDRDAAVLELPFSTWLPGESAYLYFATYHKKKLVNGYSGFIPASTFFLRDEFAEFPGRDGVALLRVLGVRYVIVHARALSADAVRDLGSRVEAESGGALRLERRFQYKTANPGDLKDLLGDDFAFSVVPESSPAKPRPVESSVLSPLSSRSWRVTAERNAKLLPALTDGDLTTAWSTGRPKAPGDFLAIDFGQVRTVNKVALLAGRAANDYGLDFKVEASDDGQTWRPVAFRYSKADFLEALITDQAHAAQELWLEDGRTRYLKIIQTGRGGDYPWSVAELRVYD